MKLRPYQHRLIEGVHREFASCTSTLIVAATGSGKTVTFSTIAKEYVPRGRIMVVAHREELVMQAARALARITGITPDIEMADEYADKAGMFPSSLVVSTVQTLTSGGKRKRMERFNPDQFALLIMDEAHHSTAKTWRAVRDHFTQNKSLKVLGVTATPDRGDEEALGQIFESVAGVYEINAGIHDGWLVPIQQAFVPISGLDLSGVSTQAGDLNGAELSAVIDYEGVLHGFADATIREAKDRKTLLFMDTVEHAKLMSEILNRHESDSARWVCGKTPKEERRTILADYAEGVFKYLCNVGVLTEGFDEPTVEVIAMCRPTKSRALYCQVAGRGTRPLAGIVDHLEHAHERRAAIAASAKPSLLIIDFLGNAGRHKLVSAADILGGNVSDEAVELAKTKAKQRGGEAVDVEEDLRNAEAEIAERKKREAIEAARKRRLKLKARYMVQWVDPFDSHDSRPQRWGKKAKGARPSDKLIAALSKFGIDGSHMTQKQASAVLGKHIERAKRGLSTPRQIKFLKSQGIDASNMTLAEASAHIGRIVQYGNNGKRVKL